MQSNKSKIVGVDMKTGKSIATDSITLNGEPFAVLSPNEPHKHLGVRMTMLGDFSAEKEQVQKEMRQCLAALKEDRVLSRPEKGFVIVTAVCCLFQCRAGLVDWTKSELDNIIKVLGLNLRACVVSPPGRDRHRPIMPHSH